MADPEAATANIATLDTLDFAVGLEACERLLSVDGLPTELERQARRRMAELAPVLSEIVPGAAFTRIEPLAESGGPFSEVGLAQTPDGYAVLVRAQCDGDRSPRGESALWVTLAPDLRPLRVDTLCLSRSSDGNTAGGSVVWHLNPVFRKGSWWFCGSRPHRDENETDLECARLGDDGLVDAVSLGRTPSHLGSHCRPVPDAEDGVLSLVCSIAPTVIHGYDLSTRSLAPRIARPAPLIARALLPAAPVIRDGDGFLTLGREIVEMGDGTTWAVHRWLWFDGSWVLALTSPPFVFCARGAERAGGLMRRGEELLVSFIDHRGDAWLAAIPDAEVEAVLAPPLALGLDTVESLLERYDEIETLGGPPRERDGAAESRRRAALARRRRRRTTATEETAASARTTVRRARPSRVPSLLPKPTIVSVTMTGSNSDIIGDALRSVVDWVDWCLLIDTGITDDTIAVAREIAGDKLIVRSFPWINDFSAARNFGLAAAAETGADWAVVLDSDERLVLNDVDIHQVLATTTEPALLTTHSSGAYTKDRFFRLPVSGEYRGPTHEAFYRTDVFGGATVIIPGFIADELEKTPEQFRLKRERDLAILKPYTEAHPDEQRWFFYLGDALQGLERYDEAVEAFYKCADLFTWDEESAWSMYRAAQCLLELGRLEKALEACAYGLTKHSGIAELAWLAGYITLRLGRPVHAVYWAHLAIAIGPFDGIGKSITRNGWRYQFGRWEGPYDVLRFALRDIGDVEGAEAAERQYQAAIAAREAAKGG